MAFRTWSWCHRYCPSLWAAKDVLQGPFFQTKRASSSDLLEHHRQPGLRILVAGARLSKTQAIILAPPLAPILSRLPAAPCQPFCWLTSPCDVMFTTCPVSVTSCPSPVLSCSKVHYYCPGQPFHRTPAPCALALTEQPTQTLQPTTWVAGPPVLQHFPSSPLILHSGC